MIRYLLVYGLAMSFALPVGCVILRRHLREPLGVLGFADAPEELDGFLPFRLRFAAGHHFGHSMSMVRRECGSGPGIVASEELVPESLSRIPGRDSGFRFAAVFSVTPISLSLVSVVS
jgi:hypothetical protein